LTYLVVLLGWAHMLDSQPLNDEVMDLISEDEEMTLRQDRHSVAVCLRNSPPEAWILTGQYAMPNSEHLIPFRS